MQDTPIPHDASLSLVSRWIWFNTGLVTPIVQNIVDSDGRNRIGNFKSAAIAWSMMSDFEKRQSLDRHWPYVDECAKKCEKYNREVEAYKDSTFALYEPRVIRLVNEERARRGAPGVRAACTIQRRWKHWQWRKDVLWNPYTEAGQRYIAAKSLRWVVV